MSSLAARALALLAAALGLQGCGALSALNSVAGRDAGARIVETGIAFGPHARHRLDIYAPEKAAGPAPVIFFIYGGSWSSGRREDYAFAGHALAARGYVAVIADYRLVPEIVFPEFLKDGALALRWVQDNIARFGGDASRIGLAGHSAGAYNAVMLALDQRYLREAGFNASRIKAVAGLAGPYDFLPFDVEATIKAFGVHPRPAETQPVNFARAGAPPVFLAAGLGDSTVKPRNTEALAAKLRALGVPVTARFYEGVSHIGILTSLTKLMRGQSPALAEMSAFFDQRLKRR